MKTALLDVNILTALVWPAHEHHEAYVEPLPPAQGRSLHAGLALQRPHLAWDAGEEEEHPTSCAI